jgi:hypothetical protein
MRRKIVSAILLLVGTLTVVSLGATPVRKSAIVRFTTPTIVAGAIVLGAVVFEHDDARMALGHSCTTVYPYNPWTKARGKPIVEFMCLPQDRPAPKTFEATCVRAAVSGLNRLVEYQFAGDAEGHGVPDR